MRLSRILSPISRFSTLTTSHFRAFQSFPPYQQSSSPSSMRTFPFDALLTKKETQAHLLHNRNILGQGTRIAVLDTGVDPAAAGLTSRVVDLIDCTGDGDVEVKEVEPIKNSDGRILLPSHTGRLLSVNSEWSNPTGKWRVGSKQAWSFWPKDLVSRRKRERKEHFDRAHAQTLSDAVSQRDQFMSQHPKPDNNASEEDQTAYWRQKKDHDDRVKAIEHIQSNFNDFGPFIEAVTFHDGEAWRAVLACAEGEPGEELGIPLKDAKQEPTVVDMTAIRPMTDFKVERHFEHFGRQDLLTYSCNFYEDGDILSVVCVSGFHGTHVAGIIAANHPGNPDLNGLAPEAEIVSLKIGDARLDSLETHKALLRAATAILDTECHLANMSFGEDSAWGNEQKGAFVKQIVDEVCRKRDVLFVTSAGNSGPALTTVGAPAAAGDPLFSIGAWVSESMQAAEYAMVDPVPSSVYTWSSRGPLFDGAQGVTCYAPGAAITSIPVYTLKHTQLINGTSMASPSACGALALLVGASKSQGIALTPARVRKAVQATAMDISEDAGLLQIDAALTHLTEHRNDPNDDAEWSISVTPRGGEGGRGIYLRTEDDCTKVQEFVVEAIPKFKCHETVKTYEVDIAATLHSDVRWAECPSFAVFNGSGRQFKIRIDPMSLSDGLHRASVVASSEGKTLFSIPITVAKPSTLEAPVISYSSRFKPGTIVRRFIQVPLGATWVDVRVKASNRSVAAQVWMHCVQLYPLKRLSKTEYMFIWSLMPGEPETRKRIKVSGGVPLEICTTQAWNSSGETDIEIVCDFHGLSLVNGNDTLSITGGAGVSSFDVFSSLRTETFSPSVIFNFRRSLLRPTRFGIKAMSSRNKLANRKNLLQLEADYELKIATKATVTLQFPFMDHLYDGPFAVLSCIYSKTKEACKWGDMYARETTLDKGTYTVKLEVLHEDKIVLEKLRTTVMAVDFKIDSGKDVELALYRDHLDALTESDPLKTGNMKIPRGTLRAFKVKSALASADLSAVLKEGKPGDMLLGNYHLSPTSFKVGRHAQMLIPPPEPSVEGSDESMPKEPQALIDLQIEMGRKIDDSQEKNDFFSKLAEDHPKHLATHVARLDVLPESATYTTVAEASSAILNLVNQTRLAEYFGTSPPEKLTASQARRDKEAKAERDALCLAYQRRTNALLHRDRASSLSSSDQSYDAALSEDDTNGKEGKTAESLLDVWKSWAQDKDDPKIALASARCHLADGRTGTALTILQGLFAKCGNEESTIVFEARELSTEALFALGWQVVLDVQRRAELVRAPPQGYAPW